MGNKKTNIAKLLKNCPKGMELDCSLWDGVKLEQVREDGRHGYPIVIRTPEHLAYLTEKGQYYCEEGSKCIIFPKGKTTWEGFTPPVEFKAGDIVCTNLGNIVILKEMSGTYYYSTYCGVTHDDEFYLCVTIRANRLATESEKQKLFNAIKANGYRWDAKKKCLEKLPKFKDGDIVAYDNASSPSTVFIYRNYNPDWNTCYFVGLSGLTGKFYKELSGALDGYNPNVRLATEEERQRLFKAIKDNGYKWDAEKKCLEKLEPQYPKTYKECCDILGLDTMVNDAQGYKWDLIIRLQELIICRDAYWKITEEKMRLKMPWEPDYTTDEDGTGILKFCIKNMGGKIKKIETTISNTILAFPTEEMRDAFYENFKESIERSKELL